MTSTALVLQDARSVAAALLDAGCVSVSTDEPFRLPSGWSSPVYMDCRRLISFPALRRALVARSVAVLRAGGGLKGVAAVAGGESSGIALAAWIADALDLPMQYVRKKAMGHSQIEGVIAAGDKVLLVDDLMAAGHSKLRFIRSLQAVGAEVAEVLVVFDYATFSADRLLAPLGVGVRSLATWHDVLDVAREGTSFGAGALADLESFLDDPARWSALHGGIGLGQAAA